MSRTTRLDLEPLLGALAGSADDPTTDRILDAALASLVAGGLRRCTVEEIAERAGVGRSTIYRRFEGREDIIHAVVARELRRVLDAVTRSISHLEGVQERLVEGFLAGLAAAEGSDFLRFVRSEPELMMFLVEDSYPAIELVTEVMVAQLLQSADEPATDLALARNVAEVIFRLAISFVLIPGSTFPFSDPKQARQSLHSILGPLLATTIEADASSGTLTAPNKPNPGHRRSPQRTHP